jgi:hypothetical protein
VKTAAGGIADGACGGAPPTTPAAGPAFKESIPLGWPCSAAAPEAEARRLRRRTTKAKSTRPAKTAATATEVAPAMTPADVEDGEPLLFERDFFAGVGSGDGAAWARDGAGAEASAAFGSGAGTGAGEERGGTLDGRAAGAAAGTVGGA